MEQVGGKASEDTEYSNSETNLINVHRTLINYRLDTLFSSTHGIFIKKDPILNHKEVYFVF